MIRSSAPSTSTLHDPFESYDTHPHSTSTEKSTRPTRLQRSLHTLGTVVSQRPNYDVTLSAFYVAAQDLIALGAEAGWSNPFLSINSTRTPSFLSLAAIALETAISVTPTTRSSVTAGSISRSATAANYVQRSANEDGTEPDESLAATFDATDDSTNRTTGSGATSIVTPDTLISSNSSAGMNGTVGSGDNGALFFRSRQAITAETEIEW